MAGIALTSRTPVLSENTGFDKGENYYFYDALSGQSPHLYQNLIASAEHRIIIWDPFFMENCDSDLFGNVRNDGVDIFILTAYRRNGSQDKDSLETFKNNILKALGSHVQTSKVIICSIKLNYKNQYLTTVCHDRFLFVDDRVYLIGASMNNQISSKESFGIHEVIHEADKNLIIKKFNEYKNRVISGGHLADKTSYIR